VLPSSVAFVQMAPVHHYHHHYHHMPPHHMTPPQPPPHTDVQEDLIPQPMHYSQAHHVDFVALAKWVRVDFPMEGGWYKNGFTGGWELWEATDDPMLWEVRSATQDICTGMAFSWSVARWGGDQICSAVKRCCGGAKPEG